MVGVNKVILIGNLGRDPEIIMFDNVKKASFSLATTEQYRNHEGVKTEETEWHNVVCWRGLADVADKFLRKSTQVYVEGKLKSRQWEDKDGNKRRTVEVVAENFKILSKGHNNTNQATHNSQTTTSIDEFNTNEFSFETDDELSKIAENNLENKEDSNILPF
ncbi:MAG: single-stranded DNA-binding protein [Bacteroidales bacterium]|nr:single-stranded DNA-binding protein [Bacteroidales bacterium]